MDICMYVCLDFAQNVSASARSANDCMRYYSYLWTAYFGLCTENFVSDPSRRSRIVDGIDERTQINDVVEVLSGDIVVQGSGSLLFSFLFLSHTNPHSFSFILFSPGIFILYFLFVIGLKWFPLCIIGQERRSFR
jgi:hypothetical protein